MLTNAVRAAALCVLATLDPPSASAAGGPWGQGYLPNAQVVTQEGKPVRFYDDVLKGKISVISFIYTSCRDICPLVTARLSQVEDLLGDAVGRDVFFVSISIDPVTDTPETLKAFAGAFGISGSGWSFLTGKPEDIKLIRHKLGERTSKLSEHRNEILLYNDATGDWERASAFADLNVLAMTIRAMDPTWRHKAASGGVEQASAAPGRSDPVTSDDVVERPGQGLFAKACAGCHTIGRGDKVGPDLRGVASRRNSEWLMRYIMAPDKMRSDPIAVSLAARFRTVRMPNLGMSEHDAHDLIGYVQAQTYALDADTQAANAPAASARSAQGHSHHHRH